MLFVGFLCVVAVAVVCFVYWKLKSRRLSSSIRRKLEEQWGKLEGIADPALRILEAEKVLDQALSVCGYLGSFGEKLKVAGPRFKNIDALWNAHRLRNRIAHEPGFAVKEAEAERTVRVFRKAFGEL